MSKSDTLLIVWGVLCMCLLWSVFCRMVRSDSTTKLDVRLALLLVGMAAMAGLAAPAYGWAPDWVVIGIVAAIVIMQGVMAHHWRDGVPPRFTKKVR